MNLNPSAALANLALAQAKTRSDHHAYYDPAQVGGEDALFGAFQPKYLYAREQPQHRQVVELKVQGFTNAEVADITGYSRASIKDIVQQPWAQQRIVQRITKTTETNVKELIEKVGKDSITRLAEMAADQDLKFKHPKLFAEVNQSFVDRYLGKAPQVIEDRRADPEKMSDEELATTIAELRKRSGATESVGG